MRRVPVQKHVSRLLPLLAIAAALAGCAEETAVLGLIVLEEEDTYLIVEVANPTGRKITVTQSDFRLVDSRGLAATPDLTATYWTGQGWPFLAEIHAHERARGALAFDLPEGWRMPATLHLDANAGRAAVHVGGAQPSVGPLVADISPPTAIPPQTTEVGESPAPMTPTPVGTPVAEPATVGEWVNGTYLDARLVSVTPHDGGRDYRFEFEFNFKNDSTPLYLEFDARTGVKIEKQDTFSPWVLHIGASSMPPANVPYLLRVSTVEPNGATRMAPDASAYQWRGA